MLRQVVRNLAAGLIGQVLSLGIQLIAGIIVARSLGTVGFGIYSAALAFAMLFSTLGDGGVTGGLTRELVIAEGDEAQRLLGAGLIIKVVAGILTYTVLIAAALFFGLHGEQLAIVAIMSVAYLLALLGQTAIGIVRARGRMEFEAILVGLQSVIFLGWVLIMPPAPLDYSLGWVVAYGISAVVGVGIVRYRFIQPVWVINRQLALRIWRVGAPLTLAALLLVVYGRVPVYVLTARSTPAEIGLFNAAFGLVRNLQIVAVTLSAALGPTLVHLAAENPTALRTAYTVALRTALLLMLLATTGSTVLAEPLVLMLFGEAYRSSAPILALSAWSLCGYTLSFIAQTLLVAEARAARWFTALGIGALMSATLGWLFVPRFGALGASIGALAGDLTVMVLTLAWTRRSIHWKKLGSAGLRIGISALGMGIIMMALLHLPIWITIPAAAALYAILLLITGAVRLDELVRTGTLLPLPEILRRWLMRVPPRG